VLYAYVYARTAQRSVHVNGCWHLDLLFHYGWPTWLCACVGVSTCARV
jgi:hypothetical protein